MCLHISADPKCPTGCYGGSCNQHYGFCSNGCISGRKGPFCCTSGYTGEDCNTKCLQNCLECISSVTCYVCSFGFYGEKCTQCPKQCHQCTSGSNCSVCRVGYFGTTCTEQCPPRCNVNYCGKVSGHCLSGCFEGPNGVYCSACKKGYHGENCTEKCSTGCVDRVCLFNGTCTLGCKSDKYIADICCLKDDTNCTRHVNSEYGTGSCIRSLQMMLSRTSS